MLGAEYFAVVILFAALAYGHIKNKKEDPAVLLRRYQMECIEETRVDPDIISKIRKEDWRIPRDKIQLVKDWALCALMKTGLMTKQGVYKIDDALARVPFSERQHCEQLIDSCLSTKAIPAPDIAFDFIKCFQKKKSNCTVSIF